MMSIGSLGNLSLTALAGRSAGGRDGRMEDATEFAEYSISWRLDTDNFVKAKHLC